MNREFYVLYEGETVRRNLDMLLGALEKQFEGRILVVEQVLRVRTDVESLFPMLEELGIVVEGNQVPSTKRKKMNLVIQDPDPRFGGKGHRLPEGGSGESPGSEMVGPGSAIPATEEKEGECVDCGLRFKKRVPSQVRCSECSRKKNPWAYGERKAERAPGQGIKGRKLG